ncbi:MAG: DoxX family protein [bacterium]
MDVSLLILRIVVGLYVLAHGGHKAFGWFRRAGHPDTLAYFQEARMMPPKVWMGVLGVTELVGGGLFAIGLVSPLGSIAVAAVMLIYVFAIRLQRGWFEASGGVELPLTNLAVAVAVGIVGPGVYSLDGALNITLREFQIAIVAVLVAYLVVVAAINSVGFRRWWRARR